MKIAKSFYHLKTVDMSYSNPC